MYCSECSVKMQVPAGFEKKAKQGPSRVCHECRYKLADGAILVDLPYDEAIPPPPPLQSVAQSPAAPAANRNGPRASTFVSPPPAAALAAEKPSAEEEFSLSVKFDGETKTVGVVSVTKVCWFWSAFLLFMILI
jgi:hypothetical protein